MAETVKISKGGRIVIPAAFRKQMGLHTGDDVVLELEDGCLRLSTRADGLKRAQAIVREYVKTDSSIVDALIAERHAEAARE